MSRSVVLAFVAAGFVAACSGASETGLFVGGGASGDGGSTSIDSGAGGGSQDASSGADAGGGGGGGGGGADAGKADSGGVVDSGGGNDPGIFCGRSPQGTDVYCAVGQQACCAPPVAAPGDVPAYICIASNGQCAGARITCDDTADCAAKICCGAYDQQLQQYREITCRSSCSGQGPNGTLLIRMCDPALAPSDCPQGTVCTESGVLPGFHYCK